MAYTNLPPLKDKLQSPGDMITTVTSRLDLSSGYFRVDISTDSSQFAAFNDSERTCKFSPCQKVTSTNGFHFLMSRLSFKIAFCYLDDILVFSVLDRKFRQA